MEQKRFSPDEIEILSRNRYVKWVNEKTIKFTDEFKERFIDEYYNLGKGPTEIFLRAGFDTDMIGARRISKCSEYWRKSYEEGTFIPLNKRADNPEARFNLQNKCDAMEGQVAETKKELARARQVMREQSHEINLLSAEVELLKKAGELEPESCDGQVNVVAALVDMIDEVIKKYSLQGSVACNTSNRDKF